MSVKARLLSYFVYRHFWLIIPGSNPPWLRHTLSTWGRGKGEDREDSAHSSELRGLMKKLLVLALVSSVSVVTTNGWLIPFPVNDDVLSSTDKPHQFPIRQESRTWEEDPTLALWGPDSSYSRVPGKRFTELPMSSWGPDSTYSRVPGKRSSSLPMSSWGPDSTYSRVPGKRFAPLLMGTWRPDSGYSRLRGKRESLTANKFRLPWQFDVHMPMIHKLGGLNIWGLDRTIVLPWKVGMGQSGPAIYNTKKMGPKSSKAGEGGQEEVMDELGQGALKALLPWGMNLQSPMLRGKKFYLPLSMHRNMIKDQSESQQGWFPGDTNYEWNWKSNLKSSGKVCEGIIVVTVIWFRRALLVRHMVGDLFCTS